MNLVVSNRLFTALRRFNIHLDINLLQSVQLVLQVFYQWTYLSVELYRWRKFERHLILKSCKLWMRRIKLTSFISTKNPMSRVRHIYDRMPKFGSLKHILLFFLEHCHDQDQKGLEMYTCKVPWLYQKSLPSWRTKILARGRLWV